MGSFVCLHRADKFSTDEGCCVDASKKDREMNLGHASKIAGIDELFRISRLWGRTRVAPATPFAYHFFPPGLGLLKPCRGRLSPSTKACPVIGMVARSPFPVQEKPYASQSSHNDLHNSRKVVNARDTLIRFLVPQEADDALLRRWRSHELPNGFKHHLKLLVIFLLQLLQLSG
jgi:hypothetical protein